MTTYTTDHGGTKSELSDAERIVVRRAESAFDQLKVRLDVVRSAHDLEWRGLLSEQRKIAALRRAGMAPTADEFWSEAALPMAEQLRLAACAVIDEELDLVNEAVAHLLRVTDKTNSAWPAPQVVRAVAGLRQAQLDDVPINRIGERWQRRLRTAAVRRVAVPILISPANETRDRVLQSELRLLTSTPWQHGDRLLSAYEAAHSDIRSHLRTSIDSVLLAATTDGDSVPVH